MKNKKDISMMDGINEKVLRVEKEIEELNKKIEGVKSEINNQFESSHLLEETSYHTEDAILQYKSILKLVKQFVVSESVTDEFSHHMTQIQNALKVLEAGKRGEEITFEAMNLIGSRIRYLANPRFVYADIDVEEDLIVIAPTGIFSIEIKNWNKDAILNSKGILESVVYEDKKSDIVTQVRRHCNCLRRILNEDSNIRSKYEGGLEVYPIILWQNLESNLVDDFKRIPVCCVNDLEYELEDASKYKCNLTEEDIKLINSFLLSKMAEKRKYPLKINSDFCKILIETASLPYTTLKKEKDKQCQTLYKERHEIKNTIDKKNNHPVKYYSSRAAEGAKDVAMVGAALVIVGAMIVADISES